MEFNITKLDKVVLLQTLYAHASPLGLGKAEFLARDLRNELVSGMSIDECKLILELSKTDLPAARILDYHNGKTIKLVFFPKRNGEIVTDSTSYDERNGKFRFLEALLNVFDLDEILIIQKGYELHRREYIDAKAPKRDSDQLNSFKVMLKNTVKQKDGRGSYWTFDVGKVYYKPPFIEEN